MAKTAPQRIKTKVPYLTPKQKRLVLLQEEAKQKRLELAELRKKLEPSRNAAKKKEAAARKLEQLISGEHTNTSKNNIVTDEELKSLPAQVRDDILTEDVNVVFKPNPGPQTDFLAATETEVLYGGARGGGKQIYIDTIIPTPHGYSTMGELKVNDYVLSPNGYPVKVIWKSDIDYTPDAYKLTFNTGEEFLADANHNWITMSSKERKQATKLTEEYREKRKASRPSRAKEQSQKPGVSVSVTELNKNREYIYKEPSNGTVRTTKELFDSIYDGKEINHSVQISNPIEYNYKELPIDPYLFGLWLGDGNSSGGTIGMAEDDMNEVLQYVTRLILSNTIHTKNRKTPFKSVCFDKLTKDLRLLDVRNNKHIPLIYLRASIEQRKELLQGILDTDGHCDKRGQIELTFKSKQLIEDTIDLVSGLGIKTVLTNKYIEKYGIYYRIKFLSSFPCFKLKRKSDRQKLINHRPTVNRRYIVNIEKANPVPMQCIQVDNEDGLYLIGKTYITTHNSYSLLVDPLRYCDKAGSRALIIRRTMPELRDLMSHSRSLYPKAVPGAKFHEQTKEWRFPSGARIEFGYLETQQDLMQYQGQAFTWIGIDEIGQFPNYEMVKELLGSLRTVDPALPTYFRCSANPGGIGTHWIKEHFIDPAPHNTTFYVPVDPEDPNSDTISRRFIPARLYDNPYLTQTKAYENMLKSLPEVKRKQWLEGRWDVIEGAAFEEFDPSIHVIAPFDIPSSWPKFRACDWGFSSPFCVLWFAADYDNNLYIYREFYGKGMTADVFAQKVRQIEFGEQINYGVMDSSTWSRRGDIGPAVPEIMRNNGCAWRPSDRSPGSRHSGKMEVHRRLRVFDDETGNKTSKLKIFKNCRNLIRTLPTLPLDKNDSEDIDTKSDDHCYDALRYGIMSRPLTPERLEYIQQYDRQQSWQPANSRVGY